MAGIAGQAVVIEASSSLFNWTALTINTLDTAPFIFADPGATNFPCRFYRARSVS